MGKILVVGSVAIDSVESPFGKQEECFGGSASYFSYAASFFTPVKLVAVVGSDFPADFRSVLEEKDIDLSGLEVADGETFRWKGKYEGDMNVAETLETHLNVFEKFSPVVTEKECDYLFLANIDPALQLDVINKVQVKNLIASDTMNLWINIKKEELLKVLANVELFVLNDMEAMMLSGEDNLITAIEKISEMGPKKVIVKKGANGCVASYNGQLVGLPAFPVKKVFDPTGAGDSFAGGVMGYLAKNEKDDFETFKKALAYGTVVASFTVEKFSLERLREISAADIEARLTAFREFTNY